jgi:hypothetical protein
MMDQLLDVSVAQGEAEIQPNRVLMMCGATRWRRYESKAIARGYQLALTRFCENTGRPADRSGIPSGNRALARAGPMVRTRLSPAESQAKSVARAALSRSNIFSFTR